MDDPSPVPTGVPTRFARLVHEPPTEAGRLQRGVELAVSLIPGCGHASVTLLTPSFVETAAASDDAVLLVDGWQHDLSEGPGLDSVRRRTTVVSQDLATELRWRSWGPRAAAGLGVRSLMSVPLDVGAGSVAALNLYADRVGVWDTDRQLLSRELADRLALAASDARTSDERTRSLLARAGLGQAQGIVMERLGMSADEAFEHLLALSRSTRVGLVRLAEHVVDTRDLPGTTAGAPES